MSTPSLRDRFVNLLKSQAGYHEGRDPGGNWNNIQKFSPATPGLEWSQGQPWCATFEAWGAHQVGMDSSWPQTASCGTAVRWWQEHGRFSSYPVLGGPMYMGSAGQDHTGVVYKYDADSIWTVEGNTNTSGSYQGDGVYLRVRPRRGANSPFGYGVPAYPEGTICADPARGGTTAAEVPTTPAPPKGSTVPTPQDLAKNLMSIDSLTEKDAKGKPVHHAAGYYLAHCHADLISLHKKVDALTAAIAALAAKKA